MVTRDSQLPCITTTPIHRTSTPGPCGLWVKSFKTMTRGYWMLFHRIVAQNLWHATNADNCVVEEGGNSGDSGMKACLVFFRDKLFPALGFGARLPPDGRVSHEFYLVSASLFYLNSLLRQVVNTDGCRVVTCVVWHVVNPSGTLWDAQSINLWDIDIHSFRTEKSVLWSSTLHRMAIPQTPTVRGLMVSWKRTSAHWMWCSCMAQRTSHQW